MPRGCQDRCSHRGSAGHGPRAGARVGSRYVEHESSPDPSTREISRFSSIEFPRMHRVSDSAGFAVGSLYNAAHNVTFPIKSQGRHPKRVISELNGWPAFSPVNCFTCGLTATRTRLGAIMGSYSFYVGLFHPQLYAGLSRHFRPDPSTSRDFNPLDLLLLLRTVRSNIPTSSQQAQEDVKFHIAHELSITQKSKYL